MPSTSPNGRTPRTTTRRRASSGSENHTNAAEKRRGDFGTTGSPWVRGVATPPQVGEITDKLVRTLQQRGEVRAESLLATAAAVLCLDHDGEDGRSLDDHLAELARRDEAIDVVRAVLNAVTAHVWNGDTLLAPLTTALDGPRTPQTVRMVVEALAGARTGDFITGRDPFAADLLGRLHAAIRSRFSVKASGAFYTPDSLTLTLGMVSEVQEGESVLDPAIGTGGMFLGMARAMRNAGRRPHLCSWTGVDVDPVAVACAAVNGFVWMLGPFVRLVVANALTFDVATLPGCGDPAFQPIVEAWNLRALATWHRCHQSCPTTVRDGELHAGPGVRGGDGAVTAPASAEAR